MIGAEIAEEDLEVLVGKGIIKEAGERVVVEEAEIQIDILVEIKEAEKNQAKK